MYHIHKETSLGSLTLWAIFRCVFITTTIFDTSSWACAAVLADAAIASTMVSIFGVTVLVLGVRGIMVRSITGVAGAISLPSVEGLQPVLSVSAIVDLVCNSVTHEAELYSPGILDPFS